VVTSSHIIPFEAQDPLIAIGASNSFVSPNFCNATQNVRNEECLGLHSGYADLSKSSLRFESTWCCAWSTDTCHTSATLRRLGGASQKRGIIGPIGPVADDGIAPLATLTPNDAFSLSDAGVPVDSFDVLGKVLTL
jgi:hypothetical protein